MSTIKVNKILSADNPVVDVADGLTVTGEVKVGSAVTSNSTGIDITGVVTATTFKGDVTGNVTGNISGGTVAGSTGTFTSDLTITKASNDPSIIFDEHSGGTDPKAKIQMDQQSSTSGELRFFTEGSGTLTERLRVTSTGDVEIKKNNDVKTVLKGDSVGIGTTTTAGRNAGVGTAAGTLIFNSTANELQVYSGNRWDTCSNIFSATGGNTTYTQGNYKVHVFTSNGSFVANASGTVDALVVAGGGGGGATSRPSYNGAWSGGGGGGGVLYTPGHPVNAATYPVVIGAGGAVGANGTNSTALGLTAIGGGRGGGTPFAPNKPENQGAAGGSGGGGLGDHPGPSLQAGAGTSGQGNSGGAGIDPGGGPDNYEQGGGGGGAGEAGNTDGNGFGGDGRDMSAEFGTTYGESGVFGGGGAGGSGTSGVSYNEGGLGGGGNSGHGHTSNGLASEAGATNTGGGGGAGGNSTGGGGQPGGPGIVLIRYIVN